MSSKSKKSNISRKSESMSSDSIEEELNNIKHITIKENNFDLRNITFDTIDKNFAYANYGQFKIIVMMKNGYVNATDLYKQGMQTIELKRTLNGWLRSANGTRLIKSASEHTGIPIGDIVCKISNGKNVNVYGTYVHQLLIFHLAAWISADFAIKLSPIINNKLLVKY